MKNLWPEMLILSDFANFHLKLRYHNNNNNNNHGIQMDNIYFDNFFMNNNNNFNNDNNDGISVGSESGYDGSVSDYGLIQNYDDVSVISALPLATQIPQYEGTAGNLSSMQQLLNWLSSVGDSSRDDNIFLQLLMIMIMITYLKFQKTKWVNLKLS